MKKAITDRDEQLFANEMTDVLPINTSNKVTLKKSANDNPGQKYRREMAAYSKEEITGLLSLVLKKKLLAEDWLSFKRNGIQAGVFKNLRLGNYP